MEEFNETIDIGPIKRKMKVVNLLVTSEKYERLPEYLKKYCNKEVSTLKNITRIHGCGANHGVCSLCGKGKDQKRFHKENEWKKKYDRDEKLIY